MTKQVILLTDAPGAANSDIISSLQSAGIAVAEQNLIDSVPSESQRWSCAIYPLCGDSTISQIRAVTGRIKEQWPHLPLVACRCYHAETDSHRIRWLTNDSLKSAGFRAVAETPAQLPTVLRRLEESPATGELKPLPEFERRPSGAALSLPQATGAEQAQRAFVLTASLHLAKNQKEAGQIAVAGLAQLVAADYWSIFLVTRASRPQPVSLEHFVSRSSAQNESAPLDSWEPETTAPPESTPRLASDVAYEGAQAFAHVTKITDGRVILAVPLLSEDVLVGVIEIVRDRATVFSDAEILLVERLAIPIAAALQNSVRISDAERLSYTDDLTQLHNARYLRQLLVNETKRARRYNSNLAAAFLDLDDFKQINDLHGHLVGSHVLMEVASLILPSVRDTDCVVRYGGDEFVVILPETALDEALHVAERIRAKLASHRFSGGRRLQLRLTASFGVAILPEHASSPQQLIAAADSAMYEAKAAGKNCVRVSRASRFEGAGHEALSPPASFRKIPDQKLIS
jgi:diguanylate cyclase (GGDEF)-like protein